EEVARCLSEPVQGAGVGLVLAVERPLVRLGFPIRGESEILHLTAGSLDRPFPKASAAPSLPPSWEHPGEENYEDGEDSDGQCDPELPVGRAEDVTLRVEQLPKSVHGGDCGGDVNRYLHLGQTSVPFRPVLWLFGTRLHLPFVRRR